MSDPGPESLTLRHLRALDARLEQLSKDMTKGFEMITGRLIAIEGRLLGLETRVSSLETWSADTTQRLERIERRLNLIDEPTA